MAFKKFRACLKKNGYFIPPVGFKRRGITLLLTVIVLAAIFSISLSVFMIVLEQINISGDVADSFVALYSADQGIERNLYRDRVLGIAFCTPSLPYPSSCTASESLSVQSGACYNMTLTKNVDITGATTTDIFVVGQYRCDTSPRVIKRGLDVSY